jgi:hypothetical protein
VRDVMWLAAGTVIAKQITPMKIFLLVGHHLSPCKVK